jgi:hypothetical protein
MKVQMKLSDLFTIEAEGTTQTELFANLAKLAEPFSVSQCGACKGRDIMPVFRIVEDNAHYEMKCQKCGARLTLAKHKKGDTLFPRRKYSEKQSEVKAGKAKAGDFVPNGGWQKWSNERNDESEE